MFMPLFSAAPPQLPAPPMSLALLLLLLLLLQG
jgi:hypothetical protein